MNRNSVRGVTALGFGLVMLAPAAAVAQQQPQQQQQERSCLEYVEIIQGHLDQPEEILDRQRAEGVDMPDLSHLVEAARQFAEQGEEERCLEVVDDMAGYLRRIAAMPEVRRGGPSVVPDTPPPLPDERTRAGAREDELTPEELEEAGIEPRGVEAAQPGSIETRETPAVPAQREAVSPVAPPDPGLELGGTEPADTLAGTSLAELEVDQIVGKPLINNWGKQLGVVEGLVVAADDLESVYAVVSEEGLLGFGGDEVVVSLDRLRVPHQMAIQWRVNDEAATLNDLPAYDPNRFEPVAAAGGGAASTAN